MKDLTTMCDAFNSLAEILEVEFILNDSQPGRMDVFSLNDGVYQGTIQASEYDINGYDIEADFNDLEHSYINDLTFTINAPLIPESVWIGPTYEELLSVIKTDIMGFI